MTIASDKTDQDTAQPPLIPMSPEEIDKAAHNLAEAVGELTALEKRHAEERKEMKEERDDLRARIDAIASTIRSHGR